MSKGAIIILVLVLLLIFGAPTWGYHSYGWAPDGGIGLLILVLIVLLLLGKL